MFDSKVIAQYLDYYKSKPLFYPKDLKENISARLIETDADGICDALVLIFLGILKRGHHIFRLRRFQLTVQKYFLLSL